MFGNPERNLNQHAKDLPLHHNHLDGSYSNLGLSLKNPLAYGNHNNLILHARRKVGKNHEQFQWHPKMVDSYHGTHYNQLKNLR